jgi:hypothetical protein
MLAVTQLHVVQ